MIQLLDIYDTSCKAFDKGKRPFVMQVEHLTDFWHKGLHTIGTNGALM